MLQVAGICIPPGALAMVGSARRRQIHGCVMDDRKEASDVTPMSNSTATRVGKSNTVGARHRRDELGVSRIPGLTKA